MLFRGRVEVLLLVGIDSRWSVFWLEVDVCFRRVGGCIIEIGSRPCERLRAPEI